MFSGRLLRKTEVQFSDVYLQLAAQLMLEIYHETSEICAYMYCVYNLSVMICMNMIWYFLSVDDVGYLWDTALMLELGWKKSRSNAHLQLMLLKIYGELG